MNEFSLVIFNTDTGKEPFTEWLLSLDEVTRNRVLARILRAQTGYFGDYKFLDEGVFELRLCFGGGYRVYFGKEEAIEMIVILLCGGNKGTQKKDIKKAKRYWGQYNERKTNKS